MSHRYEQRVLAISISLFVSLAGMNRLHGAGVKGYDSVMGGHFAREDASGYANVGAENHGIQAFGNVRGGYFKDLNDSGYAQVGAADRGIEAFGNDMGGEFTDLDGSGYAQVGVGDQGIRAFGGVRGGYFKDSNDSGYAQLGAADRGIEAFGNDMGGEFTDLDGSGYAQVGVGDQGIRAFGGVRGGYFKDANDSGYAQVGAADRGIEAFGNDMGGEFTDLNSSGFARVGYSTYKINGNGTVNFVQNHPENPDQVIVYTAPEGDEVATYTRGTARLIDGEARVALGDTFKWVTNPDVGLTAHLTTKGDWSILYVESVTTRELVVKSAPGFSDNVTFDYIVHGLRIGFEATAVVQEKTRESMIPAMTDHEATYKAYPELRRYNAQERFGDMRQRLGQTNVTDTDASGATALREAIGVFDPAIDQIPGLHLDSPVPDTMALPGLRQGLSRP